MKAELVINGPKGQVFASLEVEDDGSIHPAMGEEALACALNLYNELSNYRAIAFEVRSCLRINPDRTALKAGG